MLYLIAEGGVARVDIKIIDCNNVETVAWAGVALKMCNTDAQSSVLPNYGGTVFISYARADDVRHPLAPRSGKGWVSFFWDLLRFELKDAGLLEAEVWLDRYQIEPAECFTEKIEAALKEARLMVPILSPNWVQRPCCRRELERFCELQADASEANDNIAPVYKKEPPPSDIPKPLHNRVGYRFFACDPSGEVHDYYYWGGLKERQAYHDELKRLADWIYKKLTHTPQRAVPVALRKGRTLFVAVAADELRDARQRLVNDLTGAGFTVLPADRLPDTAADAEAAVREALSTAELAVHMLGEAKGFTPGGGQEPILALQLRLARERAIQGGLPAQILWVPKWLPGRPSTKRDPFAVVAQYGEQQVGEEVYAEEITDLSQWLRGRLDQSEPKPPERALRHLLVVGASAADDHLVSTLAGQLQNEDVQVEALFAGDPLPAIEPATAFSVLVPWGEAGREELNAVFATLKPLAITVLRLPGGDEAAKKRFFAKHVCVENLKELPTDRKAARELLVHLEILEPTP